MAADLEKEMGAAQLYHEKANNQHYITGSDLEPTRRNNKGDDHKVPGVTKTLQTLKQQDGQ